MSQQPWSFEASVPRGSLLPSAGVGMKTGSMGKILHPSFEQTKWAEEWLCDATYSIIFRCMENQIVLPYKREMWWNVCVFVRLSLIHYLVLPHVDGINALIWLLFVWAGNKLEWQLLKWKIQIYSSQAPDRVADRACDSWLREYKQTHQA